MDKSTVITVVGLLTTVFRDEIKASIKTRWRSFRKARTEDFKLLTRRSLGPYGEKHQVPDPIHRLTKETLCASLWLLLALGSLKSYPFGMKITAVIYYVAMARFFLIMTFLTGYRAKLLPHVFLRGRSAGL
jgi:hypothetical protein